MKKVNYNYLIFILELCCAFCIYKNIHPGNKVIEIDDEESLKKENLTIEPVIEEFNNLRDKTKELKDRIEKEIEKINILYENVNNEVTKYFKDKHEILIKEENEL